MPRADRELSDVHLVPAGGPETEADGGDAASVEFGEIHRAGGPLPRRCRAGDLNTHHVGGRIREDQRELHGCGVGGHLLVGHRGRGVLADGQVGFEQPQGGAFAEVSMDDERTAAPPAALRCELGRQVLPGRALALQLVPVVEVHLRPRAVGVDPPLPAGKDGLGVDVRPLPAGGLPVVEPLHAVAGVEGRVEGVTADDGTLWRKIGHPHPSRCIGHTDVGSGVARDLARVARILLNPGEVHPLPLRDHPLEGVLLHQGQRPGQLRQLHVVVQPSLVVVARGEQRHGCAGAVTVGRVEFWKLSG